jgi:excisionase family DNA binding protein
MPVPAPSPRPPRAVGRLISCRAASDLLAVSDDTIRRMAREGKLEAVLIGKRCLRISEASVLALLPAAKSEGGVQ